MSLAGAIRGSDQEHFMPSLPSTADPPTSIDREQWAACFRPIPRRLFLVDLKTNIQIEEQYRLLSLNSKRNGSHCYAIISLPAFPDKLIVEANSANDVYQVLNKKIPMDRIRQLNHKESIDWFCAPVKCLAFQPGRIVRMVDHEFSNDAAQIVDIDNNTGRMVLKLWPHIDYDGLQTLNVGSQRVLNARMPRGYRPPPVPFDEPFLKRRGAVFSQCQLRLKIAPGGFVPAITWDGEVFIGKFQYVSDIPMTSIMTTNLRITEQEYARFDTGVAGFELINDEFMRQMRRTKIIKSEDPLPIQKERQLRDSIGMPMYPPQVYDRDPKTQMFAHGQEFWPRPTMIHDVVDSIVTNPLPPPIDDGIDELEESPPAPILAKTSEKKPKIVEKASPRKKTERKVDVKPVEVQEVIEPPPQTKSEPKEKPVTEVKIGDLVEFNGVRCRVEDMDGPDKLALSIAPETVVGPVSSFRGSLSRKEKLCWESCTANRKHQKREPRRPEFVDEGCQFDKFAFLRRMQSPQEEKKEKKVAVGTSASLLRELPYHLHDMVMLTTGKTAVITKCRPKRYEVLTGDGGRFEVRQGEIAKRIQNQVHVEDANLQKICMNDEVSVHGENYSVIGVANDVLFLKGNDDEYCTIEARLAVVKAVATGKSRSLVGAIVRKKHLNNELSDPYRITDVSSKGYIVVYNGKHTDKFKLNEHNKTWIFDDQVRKGVV